MKKKNKKKKKRGALPSSLFSIPKTYLKVWYIWYIWCIMGKDSNPFEILDGYDNFKQLKYIEYHMSGLKTERHKEAWVDFTMKINEYATLWDEESLLGDKLKIAKSQSYNINESNSVVEECNVNYRRRKELDEFFGDISPFRYNSLNKIATEEKEYILAKLYDIKPFIHQYMINISPRWDTEHEPTDIEIQLFRKCILEYVNQGVKGGWWESGFFTLESGGTGKHLHAHLVLKPNKDILKSVDSYMDGNHSSGFTKVFSKHMGQYGECKGRFAIQKKVLRNEELVDDKIDYLRENMKEEGHKNKPHPTLNRIERWRKGI